MKRNFYYGCFLLTFAATIVLSSCGSSIPPDVYQNDFDKDSLGTDYSNTIYKHKEPITTFEMKDNNDSFKIFVYKRVVEERVGANLGLSSQIDYDLSAVAFKNNKLFYWGYHDDFKKENDPLIQLLGEKVSEKLLNGDK